MTATANLSITKIDASQAQKEVTANEAFDVLDASSTGLAIALSDANYTLSAATTPQEWQYFVIKFTGALTAGRNIIVPTNAKPYIIVNATTGGFALTVKTSGGTGVSVSASAASVVFCDGTNVVAVTPGAGSGTVTSVSTTQPSAGFTITGGPVTGSGTFVFTLSDDLAALEALSSTGLARRTGSNTWTVGTQIATAEVADDAITYAKIQNVSATDKLLGRSTAGAGDIEEITCTAAGRALLDDASALDQRTTLGLGTAAVIDIDTDGTLAANSDSKIATQKALKTYADSLIAANDAMKYISAIDCSANPDYPAADAGHTYKVSVAGKIGGASGTNVEAGDMLLCTADGTASGNQATVGAYWNIVQTNLDGAVIGPASSVNNRVAFFSGTSGKLIADSGLTLAGTNTGDETTTTAGALISGATGKTTPVDADYIGLMDSAASNILKKVSWANIKATLKAYLDTLYAPLTQPFSFSLFYPGVPTSSALVGILAAPASISTLTFAAAIAGSAGKALTAATAQTDFDVRKNATTSANGSSVGTIRFAAAGTVPTFIAASGFTLTGGSDYLTIWAPASADATLADIGVSLYATR